MILLQICCLLTALLGNVVSNPLPPNYASTTLRLFTMTGSWKLETLKSTDIKAYLQNTRLSDCRKDSACNEYLTERALKIKHDLNSENTRGRRASATKRMFKATVSWNSLGLLSSSEIENVLRNISHSSCVNDYYCVDYALKYLSVFYGNSTLENEIRSIRFNSGSNRIIHQNEINRILEDTTTNTLSNCIKESDCKAKLTFGIIAFVQNNRSLENEIATNGRNKTTTLSHAASAYDCLGKVECIDSVIKSLRSAQRKQLYLDQFTTGSQTEYRWTFELKPITSTMVIDGLQNTSLSDCSNDNKCVHNLAFEIMKSMQNSTIYLSSTRTTTLALNETLFDSLINF